MLAPWPGMELTPLALEDEDLTTGLPGGFPYFSFPLLYFRANATLLSLSWLILPRSLPQNIFLLCLLDIYSHYKQTPPHSFLLYNLPSLPFVLSWKSYFWDYSFEVRWLKTSHNPYIIGAGGSSAFFFFFHFHYYQTSTPLRWVKIPPPLFFLIHWFMVLDYIYKSL